MEKAENILAVVHLVWAPLGVEEFRAFVRSYLEHPAGCEHDLVILFNGVAKEGDTAPWHAILREGGIRYYPYYLPSGMDIEAYHWIATRLQHRYVLFLNSYSRLLADQWGRYYLEAVGNKTVGAVSATGSWQSLYSTVYLENRRNWEPGKSPGANFRKYKLFLKSFLYWRLLFKPFPNPHLRTSAFIIRRELFVSVRRPAVFANKFAAYVYESGKKGLSGQLLKSGYELLVVDRFGRVYAKDQWKISEVFWIGEQENLLVSDNQTRSYEEADPAGKRKFTYLAWGIT